MIFLGKLSAISGFGSTLMAFKYHYGGDGVCVVPFQGCQLVYPDARFNALTAPALRRLVGSLVCTFAEVPCWREQCVALSGHSEFPVSLWRHHHRVQELVCKAHVFIVI